MPSKLHLIKHKNNYLGLITSEPPVIFGFIKASHAQQVKKMLKFDNMVTQVNEDIYVIAPPKTPLMKPINKRAIKIVESSPIDAAIEFNIYNIELKLIDELFVTDTELKVVSNFKITTLTAE